MAKYCVGFPIILNAKIFLRNRITKGTQVNSKAIKKDESNCEIDWDFLHDFYNNSKLSLIHYLHHAEERQGAKRGCKFSLTWWDKEGDSTP